MANKNAKSPYTRLLSDAKSFINKAKNRKQTTMFAGLGKNTNYSFADVYERMKAAESLGYEVLLVPSSEDGKYSIVYREKFPTIPFEFLY